MFVFYMSYSLLFLRAWMNRVLLNQTPGKNAGAGAVAQHVRTLIIVLAQGLVPSPDTAANNSNSSSKGSIALVLLLWALGTHMVHTQTWYASMQTKYPYNSKHNVQVYGNISVLVGFVVVVF